MPSPTIAIQQQFSGSGGAWTDVTGDVRGPIDCRYGIPGAGPLDLVASTGTLNFALSNRPNNSGSVAGYYSPDHVSKRAGFDLGIGTRLKLSYGGTDAYKFSGWLDSIEPDAGQYRERLSRCTAVDWMDVAAKFRLNIGTQTNTNANSLVNLIQAMARPQPPGGISLDVGQSTFPYCFDNSEQERQTALAEFGRIMRSEYGYLFLRGNATAGGVLRMQNRNARLAPTSIASFNDTMVRLQAGQRRDDLVNRVKATARPRRADSAANQTLYQLPQPQSSAIAPGESRTFTGYYTDPTLRASRVGGKDMVAPVATTHYTMHTAADGTGTDLTASFTVAATYGANSVDYVVTNNHATLSGYITKLEAVGRGLYDYSPASADREDSTSISTYGERLLSIDMPYQSDLSVAQTVADLILMIRKVPRSQEIEMTYFANRDATLLGYAVSLEPGDAITVTETITGISFIYWINEVRLHIEPGAGGAPNLWVTYLLQLSPSEGYWYLGLTGHSELGYTTYLG